MCYSFEVSLLSWIGGVSISMYLFQRNKNYDRWNAAFIFTFISMQLIEAILWKTIEYRNKKLNSLITAIAILALYSQPMVNSLMGYKYTNQIVLFFIGLLYSLFIVIATYKITTTALSNYHTDVGINGHLVWNSDNSKYFFAGNYNAIRILYILGLFLPLLYQQPFLTRALPLLSIGFITLIISMLNTSYDETSSMWCFLALLYGITAMLQQ